MNNSLAEVHPELVSEWSEKNLMLTPDDITFGSNKKVWGTVTIGSKGQIVIPKAARETFELNEGDRLVVLGDDAEGIALVKADVFEQRVQEALKLSRQMTNE